MRRPALALASIATILVLGACESQKSSNPLSPTIAGPIPGVQITTPVLLEPGQGWKFRDRQQPITLVIENASTNGVRPLFYAVEIAVDAGFQSIVYRRHEISPGGNGRTSHTLIEKLELGRTYYWRAWAYDGANTSERTTMISFEVYPPVVINPPALEAPSNGGTVPSLAVLLRLRNSSRSGPAGPVAYAYQVATDQAFTRMVAQTSGQPEGSSSTEWRPTGLEINDTYFWRARATDGETTSGWSAVWSFKTPAPAPVPGGGGAPAPCGPPYPNTALGIVECQRSKFGSRLSSGELLALMRAIARDLNAAGIAGGPFGILRKSSGANCGGYSCDIICAGQGNSQRQYDVLGDAEGDASPGWSGPHTVPSIRVDICEIQ
jgi:hypothetical protein